MRKEYEAKNKTLNVVSSKLGQRMLQGWTMLGTSCPKPDCRGTPLMSLNGQSLMECVSCDEGYNILDGKPVALSALKQSEATSVQPRSGILPVSSPTALATPPPLTSTSASEQSINKISEKIGHKLLQGWCILSEVCESVSCHGSVPLMKDTKGRVSRYLYQFFLYRHCVTLYTCLLLDHLSWLRLLQCQPLYSPRRSLTVTILVIIATAIIAAAILQHLEKEPSYPTRR